MKKTLMPLIHIYHIFFLLIRALHTLIISRFIVSRGESLITFLENIQSLSYQGFKVLFFFLYDTSVENLLMVVGRVVLVSNFSYSYPPFYPFHELVSCPCWLICILNSEGTPNVMPLWIVNQWSIVIGDYCLKRLANLRFCEDLKEWWSNAWFNIWWLMR